MEVSERVYECHICQKQLEGKPTLVEHLRTDHEILEIASYAAATMIQEQERDSVARVYYRQFEHIKRELTSA